MMTKGEWLARSIVMALIGGVLLILAIGWRPQSNTVFLHARMPELGGWQPADLKATVGESLHLRLTSDDVTHSFAVGQTDWPEITVPPGEIVETTLTFDKPGKYVFYCTRWCGVNHWRMRGTIEVSDSTGSQPEAEVEKKPLYVLLGLDIDAPHPAAFIPLMKPAAREGQLLLDQLPARYRDLDYLRSHSPAEVWQSLRNEPFTRGDPQTLDDAQVWGLVAALWQSSTDEQRLQVGRNLYAQNCAACHGESGGGNGVMAASLSAGMTMDGHTSLSPADFSNPQTMLGASPALLQGKIIRGGMGSGMPYWGPIFTTEQTWQLVDFLWTFQFDYNLEVKP